MERRKGGWRSLKSIWFVSESNENKSQQPNYCLGLTKEDSGTTLKP